MHLAQGPQRSDAGEARTLSLESSTLPLIHSAPYFCLVHSIERGIDINLCEEKKF